MDGLHYKRLSDQPFYYGNFIWNYSSNTSLVYPWIKLTISHEYNLKSYSTILEHNILTQSLNTIIEDNLRMKSYNTILEYNLKTQF